MRVLCTGGLGYIGSHTVVKLIEAGIDVHIVDNLSNSSVEVLNRIRTLTGKQVPFTKLDIADSHGLSALLSSHQFDSVIHFAALKSVGESVTKPLMYYQNNVVGTIAMLETLDKFNIRSVVFSSSATVYQASNDRLRENAPLGASNPYGRTKRMMEQVFQDIAASDPRWRIEILRYFNPVGAHPSGLIGEHPQGIPNNLFPYIQQVGIGIMPYLSIFGNDYPESPDGTGIRDYIHVEDLAEAHVLALKYLHREGKVYSVHNLGTGNGSSVMEVVNAFSKVSGKEIPYKVVGRRPGDIGRAVCDPSLAEAELGWKAKYDMREMMEHAWKWQIQNPQGYSAN